MGVTNPLLSHRKCPCCFDCGECIGAFVIDTDCTIPAIDGSWTTCKNNPLAPWATLSETPKGLNGDQWVYATDYVANSALLGGGGCSWQSAQYCVDDPSGHRGRAWVVDLWLHDDVANTTVRYSSGRVTDWVCTCNGPRFSWTLPEVTDLGCFGRTGDGCEDCTGKCLRITLPALLSDPISGDCAPYQTVTQVVDVTFGSSTTVAATGNAAQWLIATVCDSGDAEITLTYSCPATGQSATAVYSRSTNCFGTYTKISGGSSFPNTITVADCCATAPSTCPDGCPECFTITAAGFGGGTDGANANGTFVLRRNPCSSPNCGGSTSFNYDDGTYAWELSTGFNIPNAAARLWSLTWGPSSGACTGPTVNWYDASIFAIVDCNANIVLSGGRTPIGAGKMTTWPASITAVPGGC